MMFRIFSMYTQIVGIKKVKKIETNFEKQEKTMPHHSEKGGEVQISSQAVIFSLLSLSAVLTFIFKHLFRIL